MYIPPFWCGVALTLLAELGLLIVALIVTDHNKKKGK